MSDAQPIGEVAKDVINRDSSNGQGRPGKSGTVFRAFGRPFVLGALGLAAAAVLAGGIAAATRGGGSSTTATTATTPATNTTAPSTTLTTAGASPSTSTSAAAVVNPPTLTPIEAVFTQSSFHTIYTENATAGKGGKTLSYAWSVSIPPDPGCVTGFRGNVPQPNQATWYHADASQGGPCNHAGSNYGPEGHPGTVTVVVTQGIWRCTATIYGTVTQSDSPPQPCVRT